MKLRLNKLSRLYFGLALSFFFVNILFLPAQGERADDPGARECEFMKHRSAGTPGAYPTPAHALQYARKNLRQYRVSSGGTPKEPAGNHWMPLGPFAVNNGDSYGAISGRVTGIAFGKMAPNGRPWVYAATANGGVWYSDNSGDSWHHFKDYLADSIDVDEEMFNVDLMSCGAITTSNNGKFIFVGTGEGSRYAADCQLAYDGYSYNGVGVLFSSDEGKSWKQEPSTPSLVGHAFFQLAVDPNDHNNVLGATTNGLYRRVADASSPTKHSWVRQDMGPEDNSVSSVVVAKDGNGKTVFYAARWGGGVFMSENGGKNWEAAESGFPREWKFGKVSQADSDSMKKLLDTAALLDKALTQEDTVNVLMIALKNNVWGDTTLCNKFLKALGEDPILLPLLVARKLLDTELINELFAAALKKEVWKDDAFKKKPPVAEALKNMVPTRTAINKEFAKYNAILGEKGQRILVKKISDSPAKYTITDPVLNHTFVMSTKPGESFLSCPDYHVGRIELAVQPNNPNIVYAIAAGEEPTAGGLFGVYRLNRNRAGDKTWHPVKGDCIGVFGTYSGGGRGWWQMAFAVDPGNPNRLYMAGTNFYYYSLTVNSDWEISGEKKEVCDYWHMVHPDMHVLTYEPKADGTLDPDKLWNGNDGGLNYSGNATAAAPVFYSKNQGLPTILMEGFGQHPTNDAVIYAGTQDMAAVKYQCGGAWSIVGGSDCGTVLVNWAAPNKVIRTNIGGGMDCFIDDVRSYDATVSAVGGIPSAYGDQPTVLVYAPLAGTPYNKDTTSQADRIAFGSNKVWLNDQFGKQSEWKSIADMDVSGPDARIKALTFASYGKIYAGTMDGQVYRLTNTSSTKPWKKERLDNLGIPENDGGLPASHQVPITGIAIDPTDTTGNSIYITLGGMGDYRRVWRFDGKTSKWEQRSGPNPISWDSDKKRLFPAMVSQHPVSLASFKGKLYAAAIEGERGGVFWAASTDGKQWPSSKRLFGTWLTKHPVHLATLEKAGQEKLAMTFVGLENGIYIASSADGDNWPQPVRLFGNTTTNHAVSITAFKDSLYLAYVGTDQNIYLSSSADAKTWSTPVMVKPPGVSETNAPVNLSVFKNQLFLTWNLGSVAYTTCSVDGKNWRSTGVGIMANRDYPAGMVAYDGLLYAFCNGDSITATTSADGIYWPDKVNTKVLVKAHWKSAHQLAPLEFKGKLYLGFIDKTDKGIYLGSTDNRIQPSLPNIQHNTIVVDPQNKNTLYAGNDAGIYYSTDAGKSWMPYSNGLPGVPVNHLELFPPLGPNGQSAQPVNDSRRFLRAATYGRGMFERSLNKAFNNSQPLLYVRKNENDRGFYDLPSGAKSDDSPDIRICYPNLEGEYVFGQNASFYNFSILPDNKVFVRTAVNEAQLTAQPDQEVIQDGILKYVFRNDGNPTDALKVYAQVHNNGRAWPQSINFYVLAVPKVEKTLPNLPAGYAASLKTASVNSSLGDWKLMARKSSAIAAGREQGLPYIEDIDLMAQNLPVGSQVGLLILIDHAGQPFNDKETTVARLCEKNRNATVKIFTPAPPAPFFIESKSHPDKIVDVVQSAGHNGAELTTWNKHGGDNQKFFLESSGDGYFYLKNKNSEKYFDYSSQLLQWDRNGGHHQQYKLVPAGDDYYYIEIRSQPGKCLTVGGHGDKITLANKADDVNQLFKFVR